MVDVTSESYENPANNQYIASIDDVTGELMAFTCPHHVHRNASCKHIATVENAIDDGTLEAFPSNDDELTKTMLRRQSETVTASVVFLAGSACVRAARNFESTSPRISTVWTEQFVNHIKELDRLKALYESEQGKLAIIYGRWQIRKSELEKDTDREPNTDEDNSTADKDSILDQFR